MLNVNINDGTGSGNSANVDKEGHLSVIDRNLPTTDDKNATRIFRQFFTDDGKSSGASDMRVIGSTAAPLEFYISSAADADRYIDTISFVIADQGATLNQFGNIAALANGFEIFYEDPTLGNVSIHDGITSNFDLIRLCGKGAPMIGTTADAYRANNVIGNSEGYIPSLDFSTQFGIPWGVRIPKNSTLRIVIKIKDDTTGVDRFDAIAYGFDRIIED